MTSTQRADRSALARTQRQIWQLITAPSGVRAALEEAGDPAGRALGALLRGNAQFSAVERLEVYANAYFYRILDCLKNDYPALLEALGDALFHDLATAYLIAHPPTHPSLRFAGAHLPEFLGVAPAAEPFRKRCAWAADLAQLEWALVEAFDARDAPVLSREELAAIRPERWANLRFAFQPALQLLSLGWPVHRVLRARDRDEQAPVAELPARPTPVCVWRSQERVFHRALDALESDALERSWRGEPFGSVCERAAADLGEAEAPARAAAWLARWQADGLITRAVVGSPDPP